MKAVICPICKGTGKATQYPKEGETGTCHGCGGKGWIEIREDYVPYEHNPMYPTYIPPVYPSTGDYWQYWWRVS